MLNVGLWCAYKMENVYSATVVFTCSVFIMSQKFSSFWYAANV